MSGSRPADWRRWPTVACAVQLHRAVALPASPIAEAIAHVLSQPSHVDVNEIVIRPAASAH
ncbi:hypothetical protein [Streptomyces gilvosporeus]|uniref:hypothetical protein n=1 Tax=Streptomyces gilvosporeus TaxID=553510 RepID=UPI003AAE696A